jgi:hypothetical protein
LKAVTIRKFELGSIRNLVYLASGSQSEIIQHFKNKTGEDIYFLIGGTMEETFVYYVKSEEITKKFICLDTSKDRIEYSDSPVLNPRTKVLPLIEVKSQDLFDF